jgi:hypothetical protein
MVQVPRLIQQNTEVRALPTIDQPAQERPARLDYTAPGYVGRADRAMENLSNNVQKTVADFAFDAKARGDKIALIDAQRKLDDWENTTLYDPNSGVLTKKGKDAFNVPQTTLEDYSKFTKDVESTLANPTQQTAFAQMAASRTDNIQKTLFRHERQEMDTYAKDQSAAAIDTSVNRAALNYNNPELIDSSISNSQAVVKTYLESQGAPPEMIKNSLIEVESKTRLAALTRLADEDPKAAIDTYNKNIAKFSAQDLLQAQRLIAPTERKYKAQDLAKQVLTSSVPSVDQAQIINFVMNDLEGGDKIVQDGGGIAKFGVNSVANPEVDVANLSPEQAADIYKQKYWNGINADSLPADMRAVAFDAAVNQGVGKANEMIKASNGDVRKLIELRAAEYNRLATENPEKYGQYLQGWKNRLTKLGSQVDVLRGGGPSEVELFNKIDQSTNDLQIAEDAKTLVKAQFAAREQAKKQAYAAASDEAWNYLQEGREVPVSVQSRMSPKDVNEMRKSEPDPALYEQLRSQVITGNNVDLGEYRWRLGGKFDELLKLQSDPNKQVNARKVDDVIKDAGGILLGRPTPRTQDDFEKIDQFRRTVDNEVEALQKTTGRTANADDVQKITDKLLLNVSTGVFSGKKLFELEPGEQFSIGKLKGNGTYIIGGQPTSQGEVLNWMVNQMSARNIKINEDSVNKYFKKLLDSGQVQFSYDKAN